MVRSLVGPRLGVAVAVIVVGVLLTLDNLGILRAGRVIDFWPLIVVLAGVARLGAPGRQRGLGVVLIVVGAVLLLPRLDLRLGDLLSGGWPLVAVVLGLWLAYDAVFGRRAPAGGVEGEAPTGEVRGFALLSSLRLADDSPRFRSADLVAILGGCQLDLRRARLPAGETAPIDVLAAWGGIELRVPPDWSVDLRVLPILGGAEDKTRVATPTGAPSPRVVVRGFTLMGGLEVSNGPGD